MKNIIEISVTGCIDVTKHMQKPLIPPDIFESNMQSA